MKEYLYATGSHGRIGEGMAVCRQGGRASQKKVPAAIFGGRQNVGPGAVSQQGGVLCDGSLVLTSR